MAWPKGHIVHRRKSTHRRSRGHIVHHHRRTTHRRRGHVVHHVIRKGRHLTEAVREKISKALKGRHDKVKVKKTSS